MEGKVYTLQEVANILKVTRQTIYNNVHAGNIKAVKLGKDWRVTEEELQKILKNGYAPINK